MSKITIFAKRTNTLRTMDPGFQRRKRRDMIYDKLHRGFVNTCIGFTTITSLYLGYKIYEYIRYVRPLHIAQSKLAETELLHEGKNVENSSDVELKG